MSGGHVPIPPPPVDPGATTVPPEHEVVVDTHARRTTSEVTVDLEHGQVTVTASAHDSAGPGGVPLPEGTDRSSRRRGVASDSEQQPG